MNPRVASACALAACVAACGNGGGTLPPDPPQVSINVPGGNAVVDTQITYSITVSGCTSVSSVQILDHGTEITTASYSGNPSTGTIQPSQVPFQTDGLAAVMSLAAKVTCNDGRTSTSQPIAVTFLPVATLIKNADGSQVAPDVFYAEGSGSTVSFVGCSQNANGTTTIVRVDGTGAVTAYDMSMPFACSDNAVFTDHIPGDTTDTRWLMEPNVGVMSFDSTLQTKGFALGQFQAIAVGPDGSAIVYDSAGTACGAQVELLSPVNAGLIWSFQPQGGASLTGSPTVDNQGVLIPEVVNNPTNNTESIALEVVPYACCNNNVPMTNVASGEYVYATVSYGFLNTPPNIQTSFSGDGSLIYIPYQTANGVSSVQACSTTINGCSPARFTAPDITGAVEIAYPFGPGGSYVAALAPQYAWFLSNTNGSILNPNAMAINPSGLLVTTSLQAGAGTDFYILNGSGQGLPIEVVAVDNPASGEVFRYDSPSGTMTVAIDDSGQPWMRVGANLAQLLPLSQYRSLKP